MDEIILTWEEMKKGEFFGRTRQYLKEAHGERDHKASPRPGWELHADGLQGEMAAQKRWGGEIDWKFYPRRRVRDDTPDLVLANGLRVDIKTHKLKPEKMRWIKKCGLFVKPWKLEKTTVDWFIFLIMVENCFYYAGAILHGELKKCPMKDVGKGPSAYCEQNKLVFPQELNYGV
jgi:hypothetical protein